MQNSPPIKRQRQLTKSSMKPSAKSETVLKSQKAKRKPQQKLTQLHFALDVTVLRTCRLCDLSYTKGAPDDESLHRSHCARVRKGLQWGREEERETLKAGVEEVTTGLKLKNGTKGRVICFRPDVGGKIGVKLTTLLETISLALSSPPLSPAVLQHCKVYIFLLSPDSASSHNSRERIVGCVIAQRIATAMAVTSDIDLSTSNTSISHLTSDTSKDAKDKHTHSLIPVDAATNLYVHPNPLPTPLGIPRLFVSSSHRRLGIASHLLSAAASTFILGCPLDPAKGQIAFTQPTGAGKAVLEAWGKGGVRIYEEEQSP
ncbi:uncharacterized protein LAESUDRAFT_710841 [Laetiporus sulphureus 93-53]|uniref:N-acetyltransferase ECO1 n=1 Tax=Laetiporus sulphureus 93-53 TaxID=1314785 RepID=A0A165H694_9APHY|nr:uncharacterized protein LAESUDRAFT_710841 [Laetiporus sulphureus 93-53]KZT11298.1 hypothetical protein LAESUDRAFT_710841 [Laetiporus sulphureus 93-53]